MIHKKELIDSVTVKHSTQLSHSFKCQIDVPLCYISNLLRDLDITGVDQFFTVKQ